MWLVGDIRALRTCGLVTGGHDTPGTFERYAPTEVGDLPPSRRLWLMLRVGEPVLEPTELRSTTRVPGRDMLLWVSSVRRGVLLLLEEEHPSSRSDEVVGRRSNMIHTKQIFETSERQANLCLIVQRQGAARALSCSRRSYRPRQAGSSRSSAGAAPPAGAVSRRWPRRPRSFSSLG